MTTDPYRLAAPLYDSVFGRMNRGLLALALKLVPPRPGDVVLDIGCGTGSQLALYRERGCSVVGVDPSASMLSQAQRKLGGVLCCGDACRLPFGAESFDLVTTTFVLHEMSPAVRRSVLAEVARVLRPDGRLLITEYSVAPIRSLQGWLLKAFLTAAEFAAGRRHYRSYRHFIGAGGVSGLVGHGLELDQEKIVSGGNLGIYVLRRG